jgi:hypothetical protein
VAGLKARLWEKVLKADRLEVRIEGLKLGRLEARTECMCAE